MAAPFSTTLPSDRLTPAEVRRVFRTSLVAWGFFGSAWMAATTGIVYVSFIRNKLHASTFMYALIMFVPILGALGQPLGAYLTERFRRRRLQCVLTLVIGRTMWLLVSALPWMVPASSPAARIGLLLVFMLLFSSLTHICSPAGNSWFADVVPARARGRFLANRQAVSTLTMVVVQLCMSCLMARTQSFPVFTLVFAVAGVFGLVDILYYAWRVREPRMPPPDGPAQGFVMGYFKALEVPWRNRPFRRYLLYAFSEAFACNLMAPFWWLFALEGLKTGDVWATVYVSALPMVIMAVALPFWGRRAKRLSDQRLVRVGAVAIAICGCLWLLTTPHTFHPFLLLGALIGGVCIPAMTTADMSMVFSLTPQENRSAYTACVMLLGQAGLALAMLLGGWIAQSLEPYSLHLAGRTFGHLHFLAAFAIGLILCHLVFVIPHLPTSAQVEEADAARRTIKIAG